MPLRAVGTALGAFLLASALSAWEAVPAGATPSFGFNRVAGSDRYATAAMVAAAGFDAEGTTPIPQVVLVDGLPAHQADDLTAAWLGANSNSGSPVLLTDDSGQVPQPTLEALKINGVGSLTVIGGGAAVTPDQVSELRSAGYRVSQPYAGATRYDTMRMVDETPGATVGTVGGLPTAILASGDPAHLVDALGASPLSFAGRFPVILTNSTDQSLQPQAAQVIQALGIRHLIVVGGPSAVPPAQYQGLVGVSADTSATTGADRSETSRLLAEDELESFGFSSVTMGLATGGTETQAYAPVADDGADALAAGPTLGRRQPPVPLLVTKDPFTSASASTYASAHAQTFAGASLAFGGPYSLDNQTIQDVTIAGGGGCEPSYQVSLNQRSAPPGGAVSGSVSCPGQVASLTVSGCAISGQPITDYNPGPFHLTIPTDTPAGSCTLTFTAQPEYNTQNADTTAIPFDVT